ADLNLCESLYSAGTATPPYYTYNHADHVDPSESCSTGSSSISGMSFYPSGPFPDTYDGALFFADYSRKCIWVMRKGANGLPDPPPIQAFDQGAAPPTNTVTPARVGVGPGGALYYVNLTGGTIQQISDCGGNCPPIANATATPSNGPAPLHVQF